MRKVLVDREWLKRLHRDLDACQKVIWLGLRGADPAYCQDAQDRLKEIDELLAQPAEAEGVDFGFDDRSVKVSQEAYSIFLARERHHLVALSAVTAERDRLATENERLARDAKNDAIAYKAVIERQEELRAELDAIRAQRGEPVAEIVKCEPYEDGSTNPHNTVNWFGRNAENDLPAGTKLYATP